MVPQHDRIVVGLISDTHGLLRPAAIDALLGSDHIIHAGDVGTPEVLERLREIAPVSAVCGNIDEGAWAEALPTTLTLNIGSALIHVIHNIEDLDAHPVPSGCGIVIHGHSHKPRAIERDGMLVVNPGSAGPRRFSLPISAGRLTLDHGRPQVELITLG